MNFDQALRKFKELNEELRHKPKSRVDMIRPRLRIQSMGKYTYIQGVHTLATHTGRPQSYVKEYMVSLLGCTMEDQGSKVRVKGNIPVRSVKHFQNSYYNQLILCSQCRSPQTALDGVQKKCGNCGFSELDPWIKKHK